jgi:glycosyltransferase involved in cell wall biosynthesis
MHDRQNPLVSVIIPTFNRAVLITDTLRSVEAQSYTNWECLVVDDGSTDNTCEVVQEFVNKDVRIKYLINKRKKGASGARNTGLSESKGEFIQFLDSDDMIHPEKFLLQLDCFAINAKLDMVFCYDEFFTSLPSDQNILWNINGLDKNDEIDNFLFGNTSFSSISPLWKKSSLDRIKLLWDEDLVSSQDWDFNLKALIRGVEYTPQKIVLAYVRDHQGVRITDLNKLKYEKSKLMACQNIYRELDTNKLNNNQRKKYLGDYVDSLINVSFDNKDETNMSDLDFILKEGLALLARMSVNRNLNKVIVHLFVPIAFIFSDRIKTILIRIIRRLIIKKHNIPAVTWKTVHSDIYRLKNNN